MSKRKELSEIAVKLYEAMAASNCWDKRDVVAILSTLVEIEVRRETMKPAAKAR